MWLPNKKHWALFVRFSEFWGPLVEVDNDRQTRGRRVLRIVPSPAPTGKERLTEDLRRNVRLFKDETFSLTVPRAVRKSSQWRRGIALVYSYDIANKREHCTVDRQGHPMAAGLSALKTQREISTQIMMTVQMRTVLRFGGGVWNRTGSSRTTNSRVIYQN